MQSDNIARRAVDILLEGPDQVPSPDQPDVPVDDLINRTGLAFFMKPVDAAATQGGPLLSRPVKQGETAFLFRHCYYEEHQWELQITAYPSSIEDPRISYVHGIFRKAGRAVPYFHCHIAPENATQDKVVHCLRWLIHTLDPELKRLSIECHKQANGFFFIQYPEAERQAATMVNWAFEKVQFCLERGGPLPDEPPPNNIVTVNRPKMESEEPYVPPLSDEEMNELIVSALPMREFYTVLAEAKKYDGSFSGKVTHHGMYYHYNSVEFELAADASEWIDPATGRYLEEEQYEPINSRIASLQEAIAEKVKDICRAIYRQLDKENDYRYSDEGLSEQLRGNEYKFTEDGEHVEGDDDGLTFDQLPRGAKPAAIEWMRKWNYDDPEPFYYEGVTDEWEQELLPAMGFGDPKYEKPKVYWRGFSSQGDGACFVCNSFDLEKFVEFFTGPREAWLKELGL